MRQYGREELQLLFQVHLGLFLVFGFSCYLLIAYEQFPWLSLIGSAVGVAIIVFFYRGKSTAPF
ncbi:hypothetical protein ACIQYS_13855 [Psychrobacillus sp. NPDC096426]|uniref:hypothetical protein n=1 Tax=Psychrobacillus sp. NPDC096426 TaxID=3364491 RepID=UPI0037F923C2